MQGYWALSAVTSAILCGCPVSITLRERRHGALANRQRGEKAQQRGHALRRIGTNETVCQVARQPLRVHRWHKAGARASPQGCLRERVSPPQPPALQSAQWNGQAQQRRRACAGAGMAVRTQNHRQRQIHAPAQKANGDGCRTFATTAATKAQARFELSSNFAQTSARLAGIVATMQHPAARTAPGTGLLSEFLIDAQQQLKESWVLNKKVGHWRGLKV